MMSPASARLPDGRLHLQHGPIDVVIQAWGETPEVEAAYAQATQRFGSVLGELVAELPRLRSPAGATYPLLRGTVARRMAAAVWPHREVFVTPMAAVAGAVADELLEALLDRRRLAKACVNDGGDIALHIAEGESLHAGIVDDVANPAVDASLRIPSSLPVRGIATSGWRGRSQSLGIADAVTVLARSAAEADAAATMIANAVDVDHPAIRRLPARQVKEDSDLGDRPVTVEVGPLPREAAEAALRNGAARAEALCARGLVHAAYLSLQGLRAVVPAAEARTLTSTNLSHRRSAHDRP
jgi:ApbE superfamily uncharacterized protein (UPF0280 family)